MNPHRELYNSHWTPELAKIIAEAPPTDKLVAGVMAEDWEGAERLAAGEPATGEMIFDHVGLRGPPGRLHGGLHCYIRTLAILGRIPRAEGKSIFPCAMNVGLGAALPLGTPVPFAAQYHAREDGSWWFASKFNDNPRLQAAAWSIEPEQMIAKEHLARWKERYLHARDSEHVKELRAVGLPYYGTDDICWCATAPEGGGAPYEAMNRFVAREGFYGLSLSCVYLDNTGALTRALYDTMTPHFTTRVSISIAQQYIPTTERILFLGDRAGRKSAPFSKAKPVVLDGKEQGTETSEVLMVSENFKRVYAHGWVESHPIDISRLAAKIPHE